MDCYRVYAIRNDVGRIYIGLTDDLDRRLAQHNSGISKWTKNRGPLSRIWSSDSMDVLVANLGQLDLLVLRLGLVRDLLPAGLRVKTLLVRFQLLLDVATLLRVQQRSCHLSLFFQDASNARAFSQELLSEWVADVIGIALCNFTTDHFNSQ